MAGVTTSTSGPKLSFKRTLEWIGSPRAFSWPAIILIASWPWFSGSFSEPMPGYQLPISIHLYDLMTGVIPSVVLIGARWLLKANQPTKFRGSSATTLAIWTAAALSSLVPLWSLSLVSTVPAVYFSAIPIGIASSLGQILVTSTVCIVLIELRQSAKQLARKQHALRLTQAGLVEQISKQREALEHEVESKLSVEISNLQSQVNRLVASKSSGATSTLADYFKAAIDDVVRPLSVDIAESGPAANRNQIRSIRELEKRIKRLPMSERMKLSLPLSRVFNLPFVILYLLLFGLPSYWFAFGIQGLFEVGLPASVITVALVFWARKLTAGITATYLLALIEVLIASALASVPFILLGALLLPIDDQGLALFLALEAFLICLVTFYGSLFAEASFIILERAKVATNELRKLVGYLQNETEINRRTIAQLVHGKVQARLQAATIRLQQAESITDDLLAEITADLSAAVLDTSETNGDRASAAEQLAEMASQWAGICDLTFELEPGVEAVTDANAVAKAAVVEVIRESVNNAVKHSDADEADARVSLVGPGELQVVVRNAVYSNSAGAQATHPRGYGSQVLDQITDGWQLKFEDGDAILTAQIKVNDTKRV